MGEWGRRLQRNTEPEPFLFRVSLELTERCNLRCVHCYVDRPADDRDAKDRELTLAEWKDILDQLADVGVIWLLVTGGEPLLRPDFAEFYTYAKRKGFHVILFTNGTLLTPELADLLAAYPPWEVEVTLYGATAKTYDRVTGVPGSYRRCLQGIEMLLDQDVTLNLKTMALTLNLHEIRAMQQMAEAWGTRFRYDPMVHSRLDGDRSRLAYRLSPERIIALERDDPSRLQQWHDFCGQPWSTPDHDRLFTCGAARSSCHLGAYGGAYPCLMVRWTRYDLRSGSVRDMVKGFLPRVSETEMKHDWTCRECDLRILCGNCPGWAYVQTGDPEAPEQFRCRLALLRHREFGLRVDATDDWTIPQVSASGEMG
jgi:radical SAM protein with 4Fe4S-binding SPASM domain